MPTKIKLSASSFVSGSGSLSIDYATLLSNGGSSITWTGLSQNGQAVAGGVYVIKTEFVDSFGKVTEFEQQAQVLAAPSAGGISIYNSAGELVYHEALGVLGGSV